MNSDEPKNEPEARHEEDRTARKWSRVIIGTIVLTLLSIAAWYFLSPNTGTVSGTVVLDDKPLARAKIIFFRESVPAGPLEAVTNEEGKYVLFGPTSDGVAVDTYKVVINKLARKDGKTIPKSDATVAAEPEAIEVDLVPERYNDIRRTELRAVVRRGANEANFQLKSSP